MKIFNVCHVPQYISHIWLTHANQSETIICKLLKVHVCCYLFIQNYPFWFNMQFFSITFT